jgi:hypothetical protein
MIVPTIDDLEAHGLRSETMMHALGDLYHAQTCLELEIGKLPQWYRDRLKALAEASPASSRVTWLSDVLAAKGQRAAEPTVAAATRAAFS